MKQVQSLPQDFTTNVPTFRETNRLLQEAGISIDENGEQTTNADAFLFYSDDEVRMRALSDGRVGANVNQESTETEGIIRKTRISFELHPSVFFEDLLLAEDSFRINEEDIVRAMNENPQMKALASIFVFGDGVRGDSNANIRASRAA